MRSGHIINHQQIHTTSREIVILQSSNNNKYSSSTTTILNSTQYRYIYIYKWKIVSFSSTTPIEPTHNSEAPTEPPNDYTIRLPFLSKNVPALWAMFALAGLFVILATVMSAHLIYKHLKYYTQPDHQRYIVRIVFMIPIYAIYSLLSLILHSYQTYFALFRDCYEAYVLYMFFALSVSYGGGDKNLITHFISLPPMKLPMPLNCIKVKPNETFLQVCRMGMMQYVILRPAVTLASAIFEIFGYFDEGSFAVNRFYLYNSLLINLSVTVALYIIVVFYQATIEELSPYKPLLKFTSIKIVVFFCFWQSIVISGFENFGWIPTLDGWDVGEVSVGLNNFLICFEMFGVAILHIYAFPYELYRVRAFSSAPLIHRVEMGTVFKSVINSVSQRDMVKETVHAFKGTKITDGQKEYKGLENDEYAPFQVDEIEMGDFTSYQDGGDLVLEMGDKEHNGASRDYIKDPVSTIIKGGGAILNGAAPMISDEDFFSLMNNDYSNIDFTGIDQDALEGLDFDDDDEDMTFTVKVLTDFLTCLVILKRHHSSLFRTILVSMLPIIATSAISFAFLVFASWCVGEGGEILGKKYDASIIGGLVIAWLNTAPEAIFFITALSSGNVRFAVGAVSGSSIVVCTIALGACLWIGGRNRKSGTIQLQPQVKKQCLILLMSLVIPFSLLVTGFHYVFGLIGVAYYLAFIAYSLMHRLPEDEKKEEDLELAEGDGADDVEEDEHDEPLAKGVLLLFIGGTIICFFSKPFIDSIVSLATTLSINPIMLAFFLAPIASEMPEILESVSLSRKGNTQNINIAYSNLIGGTITKTSVLMGVLYFVFYGSSKGFEWESPTYSLCITLIIICSAAAGGMGYFLPKLNQNHGLALFALFTITGIIQYYYNVNITDDVITSTSIEALSVASSLIQDTTNSILS
ncbi:transmembrane protein [Cavenderia fasciculata]|uniref:Transmembrane protein n=1 Tax=Cavenderia fasciculata TaxID=261658 RepID=F4Q040_CACFS|nr:uncharacterized protein DFA_02694 [Cavenderia fasciculata]EGG18954.1 transmembrane protein [Cavenderia fasciculata]|eukprot:XP_004357416.1 transmembrane protein [Cavenderia fasciculata]